MKKRNPAVAPPPLHYVSTDDGFRIAYSVCGAGQPLVLVPHNLYATQQVWRHFPAWMTGLTSRFRLVQYDHRGGGMSTRGLPEETTIADYCRDLEAVVGGVGIDRFVMAAYGGRGHVALRYASEHPERVKALVLSACSMAGSTYRPVFYGMLPREDWNLFLLNNVPAGLSESQRLERVKEFERTVGDTDPGLASSRFRANPGG